MHNSKHRTCDDFKRFFCFFSVAYSLIELHVKLMRRLKKSVSFAKWEKAAAKFANSYSYEDGWQLEQSGYSQIDLDAKLRLLKVNSLNL